MPRLETNPIYVKHITTNKPIYHYVHSIDMQQAQQLKQKAYGLGKSAFMEGKSAIPALDKNLKSVLKGVPVGQGLPIIRAWIKGFVEAVEV